MEIRIQACSSRDYLQTFTYVKKQGATVRAFVDETTYYKTRNPLRLKGLVDNFMEMAKTPIEDPENNGVMVSVQDDTIPADNFVEACREIVKHMPRKCVVQGMTLNTTTTKRDEYERTGNHLVRITSLAATNLFIPQELMAEYDEWLETIDGKDVMMVDGKKYFVWDGDKICGEDTAIQKFCLKHKYPMFAIFPNLIQHVGIESTIGNNWNYKGRNRASSLYLKDYDFSQIDWAEEFRKALNG